MGGETQQMRVGKMTGHVGFDSLPDQLVNKEAANGFTFNILCVGETGIGKSTLMNSLFNSKFDSTPSNHDLPIVKLRPNTYELKEGNIKLRLTVIETSGYGDQVDKTDTGGSIVQYIDDQFEAYLQEELKLRRALNTYHDTRVHCCLYFLAPTGHTLKAIDLVTMKRLDSKVNIVPVIGKSDTIMRSELQRFKQRIVEEMRAYGVRTYEFATDDDSVAESNTQMNALVPFAVVASDDEVKVGGKVVRAREYPWGVVVVNNEQHCDFVKLREALIRTNMEELREKTHTVHYEAYRRQRLQEMGYSDEKMSLQETYEHRRQLLLGEQQRKEEEMRQMFVQRIKEKEAELKEAEKALHEKFENLKKFQADEKRRLEEKKRQLDEESALFAKRKQQVEQQKQQNAISATSFAATLKSKKK